MDHTYRVLTTDAEFLAAALTQSRVYVVHVLSEEMTEIIDYGGCIEKYTPESIKIDGAYYSRKQFEFRTNVMSSAG